MSDEFFISLSQYLFIYVGFFACIIGSIGNILNITMFAGTKKYRNLPTSIFLAGASFGEQLAILGLIVPQSFSSATGYDMRGKSSVLCKMTSIFYTGGGVLAILCMYLTAIDRYLQTCRSAIKRQWMTLKKAKLLFLICALVGVITGTPFAMYRDVVPNQEICDNINVIFAHIAFYFYAIVGFCFPVVLLTGMVFLTFRNLKQTQERQTANQNRNNLTQSVTRMIFVQTLVIVISILPSASIIVYAVVLKKDSLMGTGIEIFVLCITQILIYTNSCASFYLYLALSPTFRRNVMELLCCKALRGNRIAQVKHHTRLTNLPRSERPDP